MYRRLLGFLRPYAARLFMAMLCMVVLAATTAGVAWLLQPALDYALAGTHPEYIYIIPGAVVALYLVKGAAYYGQAYLMGWVGQRVIHDLRSRLYRHLLAQSLPFFAHRKTGELLARITYDVTLVQAAVSTAVTALMRDSMSIIFLLGVVFYQDWLLALIAILVFPVVVYPIIRFGRKMRAATYDGQVAMGQMSSLVEESIGGIRVVKAFGMEAYEQARFDAVIREFMQHQMRVFRVNALSFPIMELLAGFGIAGVLLYGGLRVMHGEATAGTLISFLAALIMLYEPVKRLSGANNQIQQGLAAAERVFAVLDTPVAIQDAPDAIELDAFQREIRFCAVGLRYPGEERMVLRDIDLRIAAGEVVALVGRSGAGKSSLVNLIPRFLDVSEGRLLIDGHDVRALTQASIRRQMALVTQDIILFNDTVARNIAYGHDDVSEAQIHAAARAANAHAFIEQLPQGYDTKVGEKGVILSGGQRQRLSLARALLKNAPILILDEATSSLDSESERLVQQAIERLMQGRTVIVIAHRLSTIRHADRIVVLDQGRIVEQGGHAELLAKNGLYAELHAMQFADVAGASEVDSQA